MAQSAGHVGPNVEEGGWLYATLFKVIVCPVPTVRLPLHVKELLHVAALTNVMPPEAVMLMVAPLFATKIRPLFATVV